MLVRVKRDDDDDDDDDDEEEEEEEEQFEVEPKTAAISFLFILDLVNSTSLAS